MSSSPEWATWLIQAYAIQQQPYKHDQYVLWPWKASCQCIACGGVIQLHDSRHWTFHLSGYISIIGHTKANISQV